MRQHERVERLQQSEGEGDDLERVMWVREVAPSGHRRDGAAARAARFEGGGARLGLSG